MEREKLTHEQLDYIVTYVLWGVDRETIRENRIAENAAKELLKAFILLWENNPEAFGMDSLYDRINNLHMINKMCCQRECCGYFSLQRKYRSIIMNTGTETVFETKGGVS